MRSISVFFSLAFCLLLVLLSAGLCYAEWKQPVDRPLVEDAQAEWARFAAEYGQHLRVIPHRRTGYAAVIEGIFSVRNLMEKVGIPAISGARSAESVVRALIDQNQKLFGTDSTNFPVCQYRTFGSSKFGTIHKIKLEQVYRGFRVKDGRCLVLMTQRGDFLGFELKSEPDIQVAVGNAISLEEAKRIALRSINKPLFESSINMSAELLIVNEDKDFPFYKLIWAVIIRRERMIPTLVTIDALTGAVISMEEYGDSDQFRNQGDIMFHYYDDQPGPDNPYDTTSVPEPGSFSELSGNYIDIHVFRRRWWWFDEEKGFSFATSGYPYYNITWDGSSSDDCYLKFIANEDSPTATVTLQVDFEQGNPFVYDVGSPHTALQPSDPTLHSSRDIINVVIQCKRMNIFFNLMDNSERDFSYYKSHVDVDVYEYKNPARSGYTDSDDHFSVWANASYYETVQHEYTHTVIYDIYGWFGVGTSAEENAMDEAFAMYFPARVARDWCVEPRTTYGNSRDMEDPPRWHYSQHIDSQDDKYENGMILASTLWDIVQSGLSNGNDYATPHPVPHAAGWDEIIWLAVMSEKDSFWEFRNRLVEMADAWGGQGYGQFAALRCNEHGLPTQDGTWAPALNIQPLTKQADTSELVNRLSQNYPNPFNPETWIPYSIAKGGQVSISIYDTSGKLIRILRLGNRKSGSYFAREKAAYWDGRNDDGEKVTSGVYFCTLKIGDFAQSRKMILLK